MKKIIIVLFLIIGSNLIFGQQCNPSAATSDVVTRAVASVVYNSFTFTGALINNSQNDGRLLFLTSSYPFLDGCDNGLNASVGSSISQITFEWVNDVVTSGAKLLEIGGEYALLELNSNPPFETYSFLGFNISNYNATSCISTYPISNKLELVHVTGANYSAASVETECSNNAVDAYTINSSSGGDFLINSWNPNVKLKQNEYSKGAILLDGESIIIGMYITHKGQLNCDKVDYEQAYFKKMRTFQTLNNIQSLNGITLEPCVNVIIENQFIPSSKEVTASIRIIGSSIIDNVFVKFSAGEEIILENGFDSGNNFIAQILPCVSKVEVLANKRNLEEENSTVKKLEVNKVIKVYPSLLVSNFIKVESEGFGRLDYALFDGIGNVIKKDFNINQNNFSIEITDLPKGIYFLKIGDQINFETFKLLK